MAAWIVCEAFAAIGFKNDLVSVIGLVTFAAQMSWYILCPLAGAWATHAVICVLKRPKTNRGHQHSEDVPPFTEPQKGFTVQENYYSTKLYSDCASERVVRLFVNAWDYPVSQEGTLNNGAGYKLSENDGQHLIV